MKIYIRAFAEKQKEIERGLSGKTDAIINHILYLVMEPDSKNRQHWCSEIYEFIPEIDALDDKNKYPSAKQIYAWTYGKKQDGIIGPLSKVQRKIESAIDKENFHGTYDVADIETKLDTVCVAYFSWLSEELSTYGLVSRPQVRTKLYELIASVA